LEPGDLEEKLYAPGLGQINSFTLNLQTGESEGDGQLQSVTLNGQPVTQIVNPAGFTGVNATGTGAATGPIQMTGPVSLKSNDPLILTQVQMGAGAKITGKS